MARHSRPVFRCLRAPVNSPKPTLPPIPRVNCTLFGLALTCKVCGSTTPLPTMAPHGSTGLWYATKASGVFALPWQQITKGSQCGKRMPPRPWRRFTCYRWGRRSKIARHLRATICDLMHPLVGVVSATFCRILACVFHQCCGVVVDVGRVDVWLAALAIACLSATACDGCGDCESNLCVESSGSGGTTGGTETGGAVGSGGDSGSAGSGPIVDAGAGGSGGTGTGGSGGMSVRDSGAGGRPVGTALGVNPLAIKLPFPPSARLVGEHVSACTNAVPEGGMPQTADRWCAYFIPSPLLGRTESWRRKCRRVALR